MAAMTDTKHADPAVDGSTERREADGCKPYRPPRLEDFGDVRDVTLGSTPGGIESGPAPFRPIGGG